MSAPRPLKAALVLLRMVKFEHTVFALPFALMSAVLAAGHVGHPHSLPAWRTTGWILVAMFGARSAAMAFNRIVDAGYDAANPRTRDRAIPGGIVSIPQAWVFTVVSAVLLVVAAANLNRLCLMLSPVALAAVMGYSFTKRWTRWSHLFLGGAIGIAPIGAWIAVTGAMAWTPILLAAAVALWIGGFDVIYSLQDVTVDRMLGLHSLPARYGPSRALRFARIMHGGMLALLGATGIAGGLGAWFYAGVLLCAVALGLEHAMVAPDDQRRINTAFFTVNGWVGLGLFAFVLVDRWPH